MSNPRDDEPRDDEPRQEEPRHEDAGSEEPDSQAPPSVEPSPPEPPELMLELDADRVPDTDEPAEPAPIEPPIEPTPEPEPDNAATIPEPEPEPSFVSATTSEPEPTWQQLPSPEPPLPESGPPPTFALVPDEEPARETRPEDTAPEELPATRRGVLARIVGICAALPFVGGAVVALRSGFAPVPERIPDRVPLARLNEVPEQGLLRRAVTFPVRRGPRVEAVTEVVFLTRENGKVIAFSARCTHQGCPVVTDKQVGENASPGGPPLVCPCHGGAFTATGEPAGGPVKERLPRLRLDLPDTPEGTIQWVRVDG